MPRLGSEQVDNAKQFLTKTSTQLASFSRFFTRELRVKERLSDFTWQATEGFLRIAYPSNLIAFGNSPKTRHVAFDSFAQNIFYCATPALIYDGVVAQGLNWSLGEEIAYYPLMVLDALMLFWLLKQMLSMTASNISYSLTIAKVASEENVAEDGQWVEHCEHGNMGYVQAAMMSSIYYVGDQAAIHLLCNTVPGGAWLKTPLSLLRTGQGLLEYKLASFGLCYADRVEVLRKNNAYAVGLGLSYYTLQCGLNAFVRRMTGRDNMVVQEAISVLLYQYFVFMMYAMDRKLPGKTPGLDIFYVSRLVTQKVTKEAVRWIEAQLKIEKRDVWWERLQKHVMNFPPVQLLGRYLIPAELKSFEAYFKSRAGVVYLDNHVAGITQFIEAIFGYQEMALMQRTATIRQYLPEFVISKTMQRLLTLLMDKKFEAALVVLDAFLKRVDPRFLPNKVTLNQGKKLTEHSLFKDYEGRSTAETKAQAEKVKALLRRRQPSASTPK